MKEKLVFAMFALALALASCRAIVGIDELLPAPNQPDGGAPQNQGRNPQNPQDSAVSSSGNLPPPPPGPDAANDAREEDARSDATDAASDAPEDANENASSDAAEDANEDANDGAADGSDASDGAPDAGPSDAGPFTPDPDAQAQISACVGKGNQCRPCCKMAFDNALALNQEHDEKTCECATPGVCASACSGTNDVCGAAPGPPSMTCAGCLDNATYDGTCVDQCVSTECKDGVACLRACPLPP